ncbi:hypothetical protein BDN72DRAFT_575826 [Pluteus cervinus]|uniref:Uncharacterized protein n=1 Tax=Pluteus cervinus TaxID=181527 RepID=A0ACD3AWI1_9AGAR|nr:hypothetical protein BDN72DRAFT_575826 [Pluteus cervinus]
MLLCRNLALANRKSLFKPLMLWHPNDNSIPSLLESRSSEGRPSVSTALYFKKGETRVIVQTRYVEILPPSAILDIGLHEEHRRPTSRDLEPGEPQPWHQHVFRPANRTSNHSPPQLLQHARAIMTIDSHQLKQTGEHPSYSSKPPLLLLTPVPLQTSYRSFE